MRGPIVERQSATCTALARANSHRATTTLMAWWHGGMKRTAAVCLAFAHASRPITLTVHGYIWYSIAGVVICNFLHAAPVAQFLMYEPVSCKLSPRHYHTRYVWHVVMKRTTAVGLAFAHAS